VARQKKITRQQSRDLVTTDEKHRVRSLFGCRLVHDRMSWVTILLGVVDGDCDLSDYLHRSKKRMKNAFDRFRSGSFDGVAYGRFELKHVPRGWLVHWHGLVFAHSLSWDEIEIELDRHFELSGSNAMEIVPLNDPDDMWGDLDSLSWYMVKGGWGSEFKLWSCFRGELKSLTRNVLRTRFRWSYGDRSVSKNRNWTLTTPDHASEPMPATDTASSEITPAEHNFVPLPTGHRRISAGLGFRRARATRSRRRRA
jgi:hypothetical protein